MRTVILLLQRSKRVGSGLFIVGDTPSRVIVITCFGTLVVAAEELIQLVSSGTYYIAICINQLTLYGGSRIHGQCCAYNATVRIAVIDIHSLGIHIEIQVIIQERRRQTQRSGYTLHIGCLDSTVLICIAERETIRHILRTTRNRNVVIGRDSRAVDLVLPICVRRTQIFCFGTLVPQLRRIGAQFIAGQGLQTIGQRTERHVTLVVKFGLATLCTFLGSDDDDTVARARTIYSSSGRIFQYRKRLDIARVNH